MLFFIFFFNDTATTEIYTLSLHDALPIYISPRGRRVGQEGHDQREHDQPGGLGESRTTGMVLARRVVRDRKSTRLNSSHSSISYAVFCLKKKKKKKQKKQNK